jgi:transposase
LAKSERDVLNGILWVLRTGCPLARHARALTALTDLPSALPTVTEDGIFSRILETLPEDLVESLDHSLSERTSTERS